MHFLLNGLEYGYLTKKVHNVLLNDAGQFYVKNKMAAELKICETFSGNSLKEDLSIDTTFDPCYFLWDSPFKCQLENPLTDFGCRYLNNKVYASLANGEVVIYSRNLRKFFFCNISIL